MKFETHSEIETWEVAKRFAASLKSGDVVCLEGDLGAGKTTFTQGLCAALGAKRAVTSPTFCIVSEHPADAFLVVHMDLYRLHDEEDVIQMDTIRRKLHYERKVVILEEAAHYLGGNDSQYDSESI